MKQGIIKTAQATHWVAIALFFLGGASGEAAELGETKTNVGQPILPSSENPKRDRPVTGPGQSANARMKDFFTIHAVRLVKSLPKDQFAVWSFKEFINSDGRKVNIPDKFQPCLEVSVSTAQNIRSENTFARAYYFDANDKLIATQRVPSPAGRGNLKDVAHFSMPDIFRENTPERIFFEIPKSIRESKWKVVVVFGDRYGARSACFPSGESDFALSYPERDMVHDRSTKTIQRKIAIDSLIEQVVKTRNPRMPEFTLILRMPKDVSDSEDIKGVLAICIVAQSLESLKRELQRKEMSGDYTGLIDFADKNQMAILAWGSKKLWLSWMNYNDLSKEDAKLMTESFDAVADGWEQGVKELGKKYGIPQKNFLLWGYCGSAQWAHRLCLRKPEYFQAIYMHVPGSFDKPRPAANKVLWCLTTGRLHSGYGRANEFVAQCRALGYPLIYKVFRNIGHGSHPDTIPLSFAFFRYALSLTEARNKQDAVPLSKGEPAMVAENTPWPQDFQQPPFYGDFVNREVFPANKKDMIPVGFRVPLPNSEIMDIWSRSQ